MASARERRSRDRVLMAAFGAVSAASECGYRPTARRGLPSVSRSYSKACWTPPPRSSTQMHPTFAPGMGAGRPVAATSLTIIDSSGAATTMQDLAQSSISIAGGAAPSPAPTGGDPVSPPGTPGGTVSTSSASPTPHGSLAGTGGDASMWIFGGLLALAILTAGLTLALASHNRKHIR